MEKFVIFIILALGVTAPIWAAKQPPFKDLVNYRHWVIGIFLMLIGIFLAFLHFELGLNFFYPFVEVSLLEQLIPLGTFIIAMLGLNFLSKRTDAVLESNRLRLIELKDKRFFDMLELLASDNEVSQRIAIDEIENELANKDVSPDRKRILDNALESYISVNSLDKKKLASESPNDLIRSPSNFPIAINTISKYLASEEQPQGIGCLYLCGIGPLVSWSNLTIFSGLFRAVKFANMTLENMHFKSIGLHDDIVFKEVTFVNCSFDVVNAELNAGWSIIINPDCVGELVINGFNYQIGGGAVLRINAEAIAARRLFPDD